jgi:phage terminase large subunit-like protein
MSPGTRMEILRRLLALPMEERAKVIRALSEPQRRELNERWWMWVHDGQQWPEGAWRVWLIRAGRGFGKTRAGAEWISHIARNDPDARIALVGATIDEARQVMVEGPSGLLAVARTGEEIDWKPSKRELRMHSGAIAYLYSAASAEALRGPQHSAAWCDELGKWRAQSGLAAWDNLMMGLRIGEEPRVIVTTTPRPTKLMRRVMQAPDVKETLGRTRDNPHLPGSFVAAMLAEYAGTRLGRQELDGEMIEDAQGALWTRAMIEACRAEGVPALRRVVIGVDPPAGVGRDACGIVACGLGVDGISYVIEDASVHGASPEGWARAVAACAARVRADRVIAEANQGGAMVQSVLLGADITLPVRLVHACHGKSRRAEPVAVQYEQGKVRHAVPFPDLEDQLCGLVLGGGYEGPGSPDRADALVWAMTALLSGKRGEASLRLLD